MGGAAKGIPLKAMYREPRLLSSSAPFNLPSRTITIKSLIFFTNFLFNYYYCDYYCCYFVKKCSHVLTENRIRINFNFI